MKIIDKRNKRIHPRVRTYDVQALAKSLCEEALAKGCEIVGVEFADGVPYSYGHIAITDGYVSYADPTGKSVIILVDTHARLCTRAKIARLAMNAGQAFDRRYSKKHQQEARVQMTERLRALAE